MIKLYHGTDATDLSNCQDIIPGYDGMIHLSLDRDRSQNYYPRTLECDSNIDIDNIPILPDMGHWSPFALAEEFERQRLITPEDRATIEVGVDGGDPARIDWDPEGLREEYTYLLELDDARSIPLRELISMAAELEKSDISYGDDIAYHPYNQMIMFEKNNNATMLLMQTLKRRGIGAFKYNNEYEDLGMSVAIIDPDIFYKARITGKGTKHRLNDISEVEEAVVDYKKQQNTLKPGGYEANLNMEYRSLSKEPTYHQRNGRGSYRR